MQSNVWQSPGSYHSDTAPRLPQQKKQLCAAFLSNLSESQASQIPNNEKSQQELDDDIIQNFNAIRQMPREMQYSIWRQESSPEKVLSATETSAISLTENLAEISYNSSSKISGYQSNPQQALQGREDESKTNFIDQKSAFPASRYNCKYPGKRRKILSAEEMQDFLKELVFEAKKESVFEAVGGKDKLRLEIRGLFYETFGVSVNLTRAEDHSFYNIRTNFVITYSLAVTVHPLEFLRISKIIAVGQSLYSNDKQISRISSEIPNPL